MRKKQQPETDEHLRRFVQDLVLDTVKGAAQKGRKAMGVPAPSDDAERTKMEKAIKEQRDQAAKDFDNAIRQLQRVPVMRSRMYGE